ncbi:hypothetical protein B4119_3032 [Parageobacillus caldoxylosilyticus]|uniref:Uncharacterized protein n=1 Tax=Saccharococcus caldoxylosilyticus TaxID=81408 RepID=A0A150LSS7_9BACL|nr:hypothetical protein B4119_3032 [Parageobacillus caldoxylosilyticus]MBB3850859.1 hypothetical protein [Parageobacillus caldoxylosilyticus]QXJ39345.1 hypothetical protein BV455_02711 [Parageobacillus caldoxylosilyticus]
MEKAERIDGKTKREPEHSLLGSLSFLLKEHSCVVLFYH